MATTNLIPRTQHRIHKTHVEVVYKRPWMYPKQLKAVFDKSRYSIIEASTKSGKTVGCLIWLTEEAMKGREGYNYWWVAPVYAQTKIAYRRLKRMLPDWTYKYNDSELTITLGNGAVIFFKGAEKPDHLYGEDVYAAVIDEATRVKEESWHAVRSTLTATRGPIRIIGNVKGRKNWVYKLARKAESGEPGMAYHKITAIDAVKAGIIDKEEVLDAKRKLPRNVFNELYLAKPSDDGGNPFGIKNIRACIGQLSTKEPRVWGWDLAKSVDWTVGIALDEDNRVCQVERFQRSWNDTIRYIVQVTNGKPAIVDSTGVGDPVLEQLQSKSNEEADMLYGDNFEGFKFTSQSKQQLMEGLAVAIQQKELTYPDGVIVSELESFEYVYTRTGVKYSAPEGMHDDAVCALALANLASKKPVIEFMFGRV